MIRAALLLAALAGPAAADPLQQAVAAWVAADDATAMPALAALAAEGDTRAMLFLGAIEPRPLVTDWMLALDRQTRNGLLRRPGGLSGKSWLDAIPPDDPQRPLADALMAARAGDPRPLLVQGQPGAAVQPLLRMFNEVPGRLASVATEAPLSPTLDALVWQDARSAAALRPDATPAEAALWQQVAARFGEAATDGLHPLVVAWFSAPDGTALPATPAQRAAGVILAQGLFHDMDLLRQSRGIDAAAFDAGAALAREALMAAPEAAAHRALCAPCPDVAACTLALWSAGGAYFGAIWPGTPLDVMVPPGVWQGSLRQQAEILHTAEQRPDLTGGETCATGLIGG